MTAIYKPIGIILGLLGGIVGRQVFNQVWGKIDEEEPPTPTTREVPWPKLIGAVALQGAIFSLVKLAIQRSGAGVWSWLFGVWPGEQKPERE
jgi:xanthosine utilization system XapX-like protein